jgi:sterol desaturase/sphingolipid hydroxylase (fatty acid hydroxylase superfamily)
MASMARWLVEWLETASMVELTAAFLVENLLILLGVLGAGRALTAVFSHRRVALAPGPVTASDVAVALGNVGLNTLTTVAGLVLWRAGFIRFRTDVGLLALLDALVLLAVMDFAMYWLHRLAHTGPLYPLLHRYHHTFDRPRPLTLFALNPAENVAFGALWLAVLCVYEASWLGMSIYLVLNVAFGTVGHLGVEPVPARWVGAPVVGQVAGASFHAQHHQDREHNFGFYTLVWDRLFGTVRPDYAESFGRIPAWVER